MEKYKAIPRGYMTVGELAKRMRTTVRTLQYYDKEGLLVPSSESEGGRRLYTDKDMVKLHQILSLKSLGFSLEDIKERLIPLDTPSDVAAILAEQADVIKEKIASLSETLTEVEALRSEVMQMQVVDFKKYADIIVNLQMKNDSYWLIKHMDDETLEYCRNRFDKESASQMLETYTRLNDEAICLQKQGVSPQSEEGQQFAEAFWNMIIEFTGGDMSLLPKLIKVGNIDSPMPDGVQPPANDFIGLALEVYFAKTGMSPVGDVQNESCNID